MTVSAIVWGLLALGYGVSTIQLFLLGWGSPPPHSVVPFDPQAPPPRPRNRRRVPMAAWRDPTMDLVCLALAGVFFALSWGLVVLCERLW